MLKAELSLSREWERNSQTNTSNRRNHTADEEWDMIRTTVSEVTMKRLGKANTEYAEGHEKMSERRLRLLRQRRGLRQTGERDGEVD